MKQLPFILLSLLFIGCATSPYGRRTHMPDLSGDPDSKKNKPNDYCTVTWYEDGSSASTCYHFLTVDEMEDRVRMSKEPCKEVTPPSSEYEPKYKSVNK